MIDNGIASTITIVERQLRRATNTTTPARNAPRMAATSRPLMLVRT